MTHPDYNLHTPRLASLNVAKLKSAMRSQSMEPRFYGCDNNMGGMIIRPVSGGVELAYNLVHAQGERFVKTVLQWADTARPAIQCPRCERPARRLFLHPYCCAYCFKVDQAVNEAIYIMMTTPQSDEGRAIQKRHGQLSQVQLNEEIAETMKALEDGAPDDKPLH